MAVTLADFVFAVRPTLSNNELTEGGAMTGSANWSAGVQSNASTGYAAWAQTSDLQTVTDNATLVVVMDPNTPGVGYRVMLSIPAYASSWHAPPYHVYGVAVDWNASRGWWHSTIGSTSYSGASTNGFAYTSTDSTTCYAIRRSGTSVEFIRNGVVHSSHSFGGSGPWDYVPSGDITVGSRSRSDPGEGCAGTYYFVGIANRLLTNAELAEITANPLTFGSSAGVSGVASAPLGALGSSTTGKRKVIATATKSLGGLSSTTTGKRKVIATATKSLGGLSSTTTGKRKVIATATKSLGGLTSTATGKRKVIATATKSLGGLSSTTTGKRKVIATATKSLGGLTSTATGKRKVIATATKSLGGLTGSGNGIKKVIATATKSLGGLTGSGNGIKKVIGVANKSFGVLTTTVTGKRKVIASAFSPLGSLSGSANASGEVNGVASTIFGSLTATAIGKRKVVASASKSFGSLSTSTTGRRKVVATVSAAMGSLLGLVIVLTIGREKITGYGGITSERCATVVMSELSIGNVSISERQATAALSITKEF